MSNLRASLAWGTTMPSFPPLFCGMCVTRHHLLHSLVNHLHRSWRTLRGILRTPRTSLRLPRVSCQLFDHLFFLTVRTGRLESLVNFQTMITSLSSMRQPLPQNLWSWHTYSPTKGRRHSSSTRRSSPRPSLFSKHVPRALAS